MPEHVVELPAASDGEVLAAIDRVDDHISATGSKPRTHTGGAE